MLFTKSEIENKRKKIANRKRIIVIILYMILIPILVYNLFMISQTIIKPKDTPSIFGYKTFVIISGSMQPDIKIGDMVIVKKETEENIGMGDIISFKKGESIITHRIVEVALNNDGEKEFITKGDFNNAKDAGVVKYDEIEGKLVKNIPYVGKISLMMQNQIIIVALISVLILYLFFRLKDEKKTEIRNAKRLAYSNKNNIQK